tara:strand:+ start:2379 stop:3191 length:813 start_codon:yes stop_codon:yes gene_type:complete
VGIAKADTVKPPTVGSIVTQLQCQLKMKRYAIDPRSKRASDKQTALICKILGIEIIARENLNKYDPGLSEHMQDHGVGVILPDGTPAIFAAPAAKGTIGKMRRAGIKYLQDFITGKIKSKRSHWPQVDPLPEHAKTFMADRGLDAEAIEILNFLLMKVEFRFQKAHYRFSARKLLEIRNRIDKKKEYHLNYSVDPAHREVDLVQITLPGKPKVRLTKHGLSIGQEFPVTIRQSLKGKMLDEVISIPGVSRQRVSSSRPIGNVTHLTLETI